MGSLSLGWMRCVDIGVRYAVMDRVGLLRLWNFGVHWIPPDLHGFLSVGDGCNGNC